MLSVSREAITVLGFPIRWYGILIALGTYTGFMLADKRELKYGFPRDTVVSLLYWVLPAALVCARIYYVLFRLDVYLADPISILNIRLGGMAIYGGLLGGVFAGYLFSKKHKLSFLTLADLVAPSLALGQAIGRWGNFMNREAYGVAVTDPRFSFFPLAVFIPDAGGYYAATFFYESVWCLLIVFTCLLFEKKERFAFRGAVITYYAAMYAFERTLVEGLRADSLYLGSLRVSQLLSIFMLFLCALVCTFRKEGMKKRRLSLIAAMAALTVCILCVTKLLPGAFLLPGCLALLLLCLTSCLSSRKSLGRSRNS